MIQQHRRNPSEQMISETLPNRPSLAPFGSPGRPGLETATFPDLIARAVPNASAETRRVLEQAARIESVEPDLVLVHQGAPIPLALMIDGYTTFRRTTIDGRLLVVGVATRGDMCGFSSIGSAPTEVDFVGLTEGRIALWRGGDVRRLVAADSGFALDVIDRMARITMLITERLDGFLHQDARLRVLRVLAQYRELFFGEPPVLSRAHLPGLVGTSREMTGRVLRRLETEQIVARGEGDGLRILSWERLRKAVAPLASETLS